MKLVNLIDEDFVNYKKPGMFLGFPYCSGKCNVEGEEPVCQNEFLHGAPVFDIPVKEVVERYLQNPLTHAVICGGLEPLDSHFELLELIFELRKKNTEDPIVIYTGYEENEEPVRALKFAVLYGKFPNIILKCGRYIPGCEKHYDPTLGVMLASDNQRAFYI